MMIEQTKPAAGRRIAMSLSLLAALYAAAPASAQTSVTKETTDAIIGTEVHEERARAAVDADKVIAAIDKTAEATVAVRKISELKSVEIVFLTDAATSEGGPPPDIAAKVKQNESQVIELRKELEGNAMLFHAIDSRQVLVQDVLAVSFDAPGSVTIYAAAKPAG